MHTVGTVEHPVLACLREVHLKEFSYLQKRGEKKRKKKKLPDPSVNFVGWQPNARDCLSFRLQSYLAYFMLFILTSPQWQQPMNIIRRGRLIRKWIWLEGGGLIPHIPCLILPIKHWETCFKYCPLWSRTNGGWEKVRQCGALNARVSTLLPRLGLWSYSVWLTGRTGAPEGMSGTVLQRHERNVVSMSLWH